MIAAMGDMLKSAVQQLLWLAPAAGGVDVEHVYVGYFVMIALSCPMFLLTL